MWEADKLMYNGVSYDAAYSGNTKVWQKPGAEGEYLTLEIVSAGTIRYSYYIADPIEYSLNDGSWTTFDSITKNFAQGDKVRFRGTRSRIRNGFGGSTAYFNVRGNAMSMLYGENFRNQYEFEPNTTYNLSGLFYNTNCVNVSQLVLPATSLTEYCYGQMFLDCPNLVNASFVLPAPVIGYQSYLRMFKNCPSLTQVPVIAASTISPEGCSYMFEGCSSIVLPPSLTATTVGRSGYESMFRNCTSLTTAPQLSAELDEYAASCYAYMFAGCTALVNVPSTLPSTLVPDSGYYGMFAGCTALTTTSELPALAGKYDSMYRGCTSLTTVRPISATTLSAQYMFAGCTSLVTAPELIATAVTYGGFSEMFRGCTSLVTPPSELKPATPGYGAYSGMFAGCTALTTAPVICATTASARMCYEMFDGCTSLITAPTLSATTIADGSYSYMFNGCTALTTVQATLPATTLQINCYDSMFRGCTSLTVAPSLPATTLVKECYMQMFENSSVDTITCLAENVSAGQQIDSTYNWLNGVYVSGTFAKSANENNWPRNYSGIPGNWAVIDA